VLVLWRSYVQNTDIARPRWEPRRGRDWDTSLPVDPWTASGPGTPRVGTASRHWTCTQSTRGEPGSGPAKPIPPVPNPLQPLGTRHPTRRKPVPVHTGRVFCG
jgi:hypothetical protein